jgi:protein-disulfide isomerase
MSTSLSQKWSPLIAFAFLTFVIFLFFHLYMRQPNEKTFTETESAEIKISEPTISVINPSRGKPDAAITIIEFGDYTCEHCRDVSVSINAIREEFPDAIRQVWKDFPNEELNSEATSAAIAARCAEQQGKFWTYNELLYTQMNVLGTSVYNSTASALELDEDKFAKCVSSREPLPKIQKDFEEGLELEITALPTLFINGERYVGALSTSKLRELVINNLK